MSSANPPKRKADAASGPAEVSKKGRGSPTDGFQVDDRVMVDCSKNGNKKRSWYAATITAASTAGGGYDVIYDKGRTTQADVQKSRVRRMTADERKKHSGAGEEENDVPSEEGDATDDEAAGEGDEGGAVELDIDRLMRGDDADTGYEGEGDWVSDLDEHCVNHIPDAAALFKKWKSEGVELEEIKRRIELIAEKGREKLAMQNASALAMILVEEMQKKKEGVEEALDLEHGKAVETARTVINQGGKILVESAEMPKTEDQVRYEQYLKREIPNKRRELNRVAGEYVGAGQRMANEYEQEFDAKKKSHGVSRGETPQKVRDGIARVKACNAFKIPFGAADEPSSD